MARPPTDNPEILEYRAAKPIYTPRTTCRACGCKELRVVLSLGDHYVCNFVKDIDLNLPRVPLTLVQCEQCALLQLRDTTNPDILWRGQYWYRSGVNLTMRNALAQVVEHGLTWMGGGTWLDIGANDGTLLSKVPPEFRKIGCEPAESMICYLEEHADKVVNDYFSAAAVDEQCDVISSCAMFYDLDDPNKFVKDIVATLTDTGIWINQLSDTPTMLKATAFDNICHEHVTYWDLEGLKNLYAQHGLTIVSTSLNSVNGGSIRTIAKKSGIPNTLGIPSVTGELVMEFRDRVRRWRDLAQETIDNLPSMQHNMWLYGASTKGCALLQYLDRNSVFAGIADRNPAKYGLRMAGTWIPIWDEAHMRRAKPSYLLVLPWAFADEFAAREAELRASGTTMVFPLPDWRCVL